ncbi:hypothetical protein JVT61DRAFT_373 [Boletus reticuloceps]|uniref:Pleiotropic regulator 1 n=1 Tax=Boletus reticuloceps TaxID=495285 RepID=A0A8I2Z319_9AGAM|nr:hypothetical protein JVT61DRAFT_373 [Boletus reticuloceps]
MSFSCSRLDRPTLAKGHKGRVNSVAIHPSGKVALSVGHDKTLRMWDLMRGKGSASTKLGKGEVINIGREKPTQNQPPRGRSCKMVVVGLDVHRPVAVVS